MGTKCGPLLADLFLHAYEADFLQWLKIKDRKVAQTFYSSFRYLDNDGLFSNLWLSIQMSLKIRILLKLKSLLLTLTFTLQSTTEDD